MTARTPVTEIVRRARTAPPIGLRQVDGSWSGAAMTETAPAARGWPTSSSPAARSRRRRCHCSVCSATSRRWSTAGTVAAHWSENEPDLDFDDAVADPAVVADAWESWRREVADADAWLAAEEDWGRQVPVHGELTEVRDIAVHLVEEYARHVGHADLLRECIDGRTGQ